MPLSNDKKKQFRTVGHGLKPIVTIAGKGLSDGVSAEIERALADHELIKIKLAVDDRDSRKEIIAEICANAKAENIQEVGKIVLIYRKSNKEILKTSNARQFLS